MMLCLLHWRRRLTKPERLAEGRSALPFCGDDGIDGYSKIDGYILRIFVGRTQLCQTGSFGYKPTLKPRRKDQSCMGRVSMLEEAYSNRMGRRTMVSCVEFALLNPFLTMNWNSPGVDKEQQILYTLSALGPGVSTGLTLSGYTAWQ